MSSPLPPLAPWLQRTFDHAVAALDSGHFGHATLLVGPQRIGKRLLAETLAQRVLCSAPRGNGSACGTCRSCTLFAVRAQFDLPEVRPDGSPAHPWGRSAHPDLQLIGYAINPKTDKPRTEIVVEQMRSLSEALVLTAQLGGAQVAIVDPASGVNWNAWNAVLKTLEEPHPGRYLWLLADAPARLPATIRSRCQRLEVQFPAQDEALDWLRQRGHPAKDAAEALDAARGHPGLADDWLRGDGLALRRGVLADAQALERAQERPDAVALRWVADGRAETRLWHLAELARQRAAGLTDPAAARTLAGRFDAANRARDLLRTTVRSELAVQEALLTWR